MARGLDREREIADEWYLAIGGGRAYNVRRMALAALYILGTVNFAVHKAVLESGHPMLDTLPASLRARGGRASLLFEYVVLVAAMALAANGWPAAAWGYAFYSGLNAMMAWAILTKRM